MMVVLHLQLPLVAAVVLVVLVVPLVLLAVRVVLDCHIVFLELLSSMPVVVEEEQDLEHLVVLVVQV